MIHPDWHVSGAKFAPDIRRIYGEIIIIDAISSRCESLMIRHTQCDFFDLFRKVYRNDMAGGLTWPFSAPAKGLFVETLGTKRSETKPSVQFRTRDVLLGFHIVVGSVTGFLYSSDLIIIVLRKYELVSIDEYDHARD